jgi:hypothetical protein
VARKTLTAAAACALLAATASAASAAPTARLSARLTPERLGAATTMSFGFQIEFGNGPPALLHSVDLHFPANLGFATSGLGVASCEPQALETLGASACPADSIMGSGSALVEIPIGPEVVRETTELTLAAAPSSDGYLHILIGAIGLEPVLAQVVLQTVLQPGRLHIEIPPIPSLPGAPDVAVVRLQATVGGNLHYTERVHGRTVSYRPAGITLPGSCPPGGFRFAAAFTFIAAGSATGHAAVACPRRR